MFRPKTRKTLAITAINTMIFFFNVTTKKMLPKRKTKQNYQGLLLLATRFKAAVKIKGDDDRSLKALLGKP